MNTLMYYKHGEIPTPNTIPIPQKLQDGQLLVKVSYASLNPADYKTANGEHSMLMNFNFPRVVGFDFAGTVIDFTTSKYKVGDKVFGMIRGLPQYQTGTVSEYVIVDEDICALCPEKVSLDLCAATPLTAITVMKCFDKCKLVKGERVLIIGGSGGIGTMAIQIAKNVYGSGNITTTASTKEKTEMCYKLGANSVINYKIYDYKTVLSKRQNGFDVILDCVGDAKRVTKLLNPNGRLCSIVGPPTIDAVREWVDEQQMGEPDLKCCLYRIIKTSFGGFMMELTNGAKKLKNITNGNYYYVIGGGNGEIMKRVAEYLKDGKIKPVIAREFSLYDSGYGLDMLKRGGVMGKIVVKCN